MGQSCTNYYVCAVFKFKFISKMKKTALLASFLLFAFAVAAQNQPLPCGTSIEDQQSFEGRLLENIQIASTGQYGPDNAGIQYIPVYYHLVGDAKGSGRARVRDILDNLCKLNEAFSPMEMRFYLLPHPTYGIFNESINDDNVYDNQSNTTLMKERRHPKAINIYVVNKAGGNASQPGESLAYYSPANDWIVARKSNTTGRQRESTIPHEVGHFFSLLHTFYGYENNPFDKDDDATWPNAPAIAPWSSVIGTNILTEFADGSNCSTAADKICDTPADYNFGFSDTQSDCVYNNIGALDPKGKPVTDPMEENFMSYYNTCEYKWSTQQQAIILADRERSTRNYLDNNYQPASLNIDTPVDLLVQPAQNEITAQTNVVLQWKKVPGATFYLLEVDVVGQFASGRLQTVVTRDTAYTLVNLLPNANHFWRVRPFNEYVSCADVRLRNFKTATSNTLEINTLNSIQISPNPASDNSPAYLNLSATEAFEATLGVYDAAGKMMGPNQSITITQGYNKLELPVQTWPKGIYFVSLQTQYGKVLRKLIR